MQESSNEAPFKPSAYGFRNIKPRSRTKRSNLKDKVALEKERINNRVGWQARLHQKNAPESTEMLTSLKAGSAGYISNSDRFHTDTAGEESQIRKANAERRLGTLESRRQAAFKREESNWQKSEEAAKKEDEYYQRLRDDGSKAKKNLPSVAYDLSSLQYLQNTVGEQQKYQDDLVRYRAKCRSIDLIVKGDTRAKYNIINGDDRNQQEYPNRPSKPETMVSTRPW